jgi:cysteine desulfurase / selenocysteine lyase
MTISNPSLNDIASLDDLSALEGAGLPSVDELTQLANQLFHSYPCDGSRLEALNTAPNVNVPSSHQSFTDPALAELAIPKLPEAQKLAHVDPVNPASNTNFYFLETSEAHARSLRSRDIGSIRPPFAVPDFKEATLLSGVSAQEFGSANSIDYQRLNTPRFDSSAVPASAASGPEFYFLDANRPVEATHLPEFDGVRRAFDVNAVRRDFPILNERVNGHPLVWLDNAATTQKPQVVIDRLSYFYQHKNSNIHRAAHELAARATDAYEKARDTVARFINAPSPDNIVFVRGTTEGINLVAQSWGRQNIGKDDEIVISWLEHHANIVPWQQLCAETGAVLRIAPVDDTGQVLLSEYQQLLNNKTKLVAFTQVSNALGTITPAQEMIAMAHGVGAKVLLDGAQSISHLAVDVQTLDCDWFVFSGHKIYGPTGIGVVYGKAELLEASPPWQGGGNMIEDVTFESTTYQPAPAKFEAGTGNIADAVGLGAALDYLSRIGIHNVARYEHELLVYAIDALKRIPGLTLIGTAPEKTSVLSFVLAGHATEEVGAALNKAGIAVRSGHHCAQPILRRFGLESTVRPSVAFYNTYEEIDRLVNVVRKVSWNLK